MFVCVFVEVCRGFMLTQWGGWYEWEVNGTAHASTHFTGVQGDTGVTSCTGGVMVLVGIDACPYKLMGISQATVPAIVTFVTRDFVPLPIC